MNFLDLSKITLIDSLSYNDLSVYGLVKDYKLMPYNEFNEFKAIYEQNEAESFTEDDVLYIHPRIRIDKDLLKYGNIKTTKSRKTATCFLLPDLYDVIYQFQPNYVCIGDTTYVNTNMNGAYIGKSERYVRFHDNCDWIPELVQSNKKKYICNSNFLNKNKVKMNSLDLMTALSIVDMFKSHDKDTVALGAKMIKSFDYTKTPCSILFILNNYLQSAQCTEYQLNNLIRSIDHCSIIHSAEHKPYDYMLYFSLYIRWIENRLRNQVSRELGMKDIFNKINLRINYAVKFRNTRLQEIWERYVGGDAAVPFDISKLDAALLDIQKCKEIQADSEKEVSDNTVCGETEADACSFV